MQYEITDEWRAFLCQLPGYDPFIDSEGFWFDVDEAISRVNFFEWCVIHTKGRLANKPYILEPHEQCLTANIFGWKDNSGLRRYREVLYFVPRKNSKTTWAAGTALSVLFQDHEIGAECYCAAKDREQAALLFGQTEVMARKNTELNNMSYVRRAFKTLHYPEENSFFKAISSDAGSKHGFNAHLAIIDELHAQPTPELFEVLETSMGSRDQPLLISISTSDYERANSICNQKVDYADQVRKGGVKDPRFLPALYMADQDDDWTKESTWFKCNPNLGKSLSLEYIQRKCELAKQLPSFENTFKRLHLNIRTEQDVRWMPIEKWNACKSDSRFDFDSLAGRRCYAALDISSTQDLTSLCLFFPRIGEEKSHKVLWYNWIPAESIVKKEQKDRVRYTNWCNKPEYDGLLVKCPGEIIDQDIIKAKILEIYSQVELVKIGYDPFNAIKLGLELQNEGLPVFMYRQNKMMMSPAIKTMENMVVERQIEHNGEELIRWTVSNISADIDNMGNVMFNKKKSTGRIDPIVSMTMAVGLWLSDNMALLNEPNIYFVGNEDGK